MFKFNSLRTLFAAAAIGSGALVSGAALATGGENNTMVDRDTSLATETNVNLGSEVSLSGNDSDENSWERIAGNLGIDADLRFELDADVQNGFEEEARGADTSVATQVDANANVEFGSAGSLFVDDADDGHDDIGSNLGIDAEVIIELDASAQGDNYDDRGVNTSLATQVDANANVEFGSAGSLFVDDADDGHDDIGSNLGIDAEVIIELDASAQGDNYDDRGADTSVATQVDANANVEFDSAGSFFADDAADDGQDDIGSALGIDADVDFALTADVQGSSEDDDRGAETSFATMVEANANANVQFGSAGSLFAGDNANDGRDDIGSAIGLGAGVDFSIDADVQGSSEVDDCGSETSIATMVEANANANVQFGSAGSLFEDDNAGDGQDDIGLALGITAGVDLELDADVQGSSEDDDRGADAGLATHTKVQINVVSSVLGGN